MKKLKKPIRVNPRDIVQLIAENQMLRRLNDQLNRIIRKASIVFCEDGSDGEIAAKMFLILGEKPDAKATKKLREIEAQYACESGGGIPSRSDRDN